MVAVGDDIFVANGTGNSITEFDAVHGTAHTISGAAFKFSDPVAEAVSNGHLYVLSAAGPVTEIATATGALVGVASGAAYGFATPTSISATGRHVYVTNSTGNTVTVINATTLAHATTLSAAGYKFSKPTGSTVLGKKLWVTDWGNDSVTVISTKNNHVVRVITDDEYLPTPGPVIAGSGFVYAASPPGASPMVTQVTPKTGKINWMMCNTNGPYQFNNPQAMALAGQNLWIVNEGGNSLTQMNSVSGALIRTVS